MYQFGRLFRLTLSGESHGPAIVVSLDGVPAGLPIDVDLFMAALASRRPQGLAETPRHESDCVEILGGLRDGYTTGNPLTLMVRNRDHHSSDYSAFHDHPRPGHADYASVRKWGRYADLRGGGIASGRLTVGLVLAGAVARLLVSDVRIHTEIVELGGAADGWDELMASACAMGDSLGGIVACHVSGVEGGLGSPFFDSVESLLAHGLFSIPGVKGVEFGSGFGMARMLGSECNDRYVAADGTVATNHNGGIAGGITTGSASLYLRVAFRPASSIARAQSTYDWGAKEMRDLVVRGRHDTSYIRRALVVVESVVWLVLADLSLQRTAELRWGEA